MEKVLEDRLKAELLFHVLLFSYQKVVRDILKTGSAIFVHPTLNAITEVSDKMGIDLIKGETVDEVFENYSKMLVGSGLVKGARFEKISPGKYMLNIDRCIYAKTIHAALKPKCSTCRYALVAMAILEKLSGRKAKLADSEFLEEGTKTVIECQR